MACYICSLQRRSLALMKHNHEFRDPIHVFITVDSDERRVVDSRPFQRLRHVHQLATSYLVFPRATHKRFEHSLGVMHLAGEVYDIVTAVGNVHNFVREAMPGEHQKQYWRRVVRLAALCHDIGHLPFSHAAEDELLPESWNHERITYNLIMSQEMADLFLNSVPPVTPAHVAKVAIGQKKLSKFAPEIEFSVWESLLSEIIVGDAFGVDRIDYLLRDAYHAGVVFGRFDHHRLLLTLRILPKTDDGSTEPYLGIESGGLEAAEALTLARYFMYKQVYFHRVRRAYDIHLKDFLKEWLPNGSFPTDGEKHLEYTDNEINAAMLSSAREDQSPGHQHAQRIVNRTHFKMAYERSPADLKTNMDATQLVFEAMQKEFGAELFRRDLYRPRATALDFPVLQSDGRIVSSSNLSETLNNVRAATFDIILCDRAVKEGAIRFLSTNRAKIILPQEQAP